MANLYQKFKSTADPIVCSTNTILATLAEWSTSGKTRMQYNSLIVAYWFHAGFIKKILNVGLSLIGSSEMIRKTSLADITTIYQIYFTTNCKYSTSKSFKCIFVSLTVICRLSRKTQLSLGTDSYNEEKHISIHSINASIKMRHFYGDLTYFVDIIADRYKKVVTTSNC